MPASMVIIEEPSHRGILRKPQKECKGKYCAFVNYYHDHYYRSI